MAVSFLNPVTTPKAWDFFYAAGLVAPGIAKIADAVRENNWDVKVGPGASGATTTFRGLKIVHFTLQLTLIGAGALDALPSFLDALRFDPSRPGNNALEVYHEALNALDPPIKAAAVESLGVPKQSGPGGYWTMEIKFIEYRPPPPKNVTKTPSGASAAAVSGAVAQNGVGKAPLPAKDANDVLIGQLLNQAGLTS